MKLGKGGITTINARKRPVYVVDGFTMKYGDLFAQNVSGVYSGEGLEGYSVTYRLFTPKIGELIRGEAQRKKALAAQGKVYLKYIDHLTGGKCTRVLYSNYSVQMSLILIPSPRDATLSSMPSSA